MVKYRPDKQKKKKQYSKECEPRGNQFFFNLK